MTSFILWIINEYILKVVFFTHTVSGGVEKTPNNFQSMDKNIIFLSKHNIL